MVSVAYACRRAGGRVVPALLVSAGCWYRTAARILHSCRPPCTLYSRGPLPAQRHACTRQPPPPPISRPGRPAAGVALAGGCHVTRNPGQWPPKARPGPSPNRPRQRRRRQRVAAVQMVTEERRAAPESGGPSKGVTHCPLKRGGRLAARRPLSAAQGRVGVGITQRPRPCRGGARPSANAAAAQGACCGALWQRAGVYKTKTRSLM